MQRTLRFALTFVALGLLAGCVASEEDIVASQTGELRGGQRGERCGDRHCAVGDVCCNSSCGICVPPGYGCTQQACQRIHGRTGECRNDGDCRTFSNYCDGCSCDALAEGESDPGCLGTTVQCFAEPCMGQVAVCDRDTRTCVLAAE